MAIDRAREVPFDLAIIDLRMPDISGIEVLKALKRANPQRSGGVAVLAVVVCLLPVGLAAREVPGGGWMAGRPRRGARLGIPAGSEV